MLLQVRIHHLQETSHRSEQTRPDQDQSPVSFTTEFKVLWVSYAQSLASTWDSPWDKNAQAAAGQNLRAAFGKRPMSYGQDAQLTQRPGLTVFLYISYLNIWRPESGPKLLSNRVALTDPRPLKTAKRVLLYQILNSLQFFNNIHFSPGPISAYYHVISLNHLITVTQMPN